MKTPDQNFGSKFSETEVKKRYLEQGFIAGSDVDGNLLEDQMWHKKVTVVLIGGGSPKIYSKLKLDEFRDLQGYGFKLPNGEILLISRYARNIKEDLSNCLFKIE